MLHHFMAGKIIISHRELEYTCDALIYTTLHIHVQAVCGLHFNRCKRASVPWATKKIITK